MLSPYPLYLCVIVIPSLSRHSYHLFVLYPDTPALCLFRLPERLERIVLLAVAESPELPDQITSGVPAEMFR